MFFFYSFHLKVSLEIGVAAVPGCLDDGLYYFILEKLKIFGVTFIGTVLKLGTNIMSRWVFIFAYKEAAGYMWTI